MVEIKETERAGRLKKGEIIQTGTHKNLILKPGYYNKLYEKQKDEKLN